MDLDNEENYFTRRQNGAIKDKDVEKAFNIARNITEDDLLNYWEGPEEPYNAIQTILNELKYREAEIEKDNNIISDLQNEVTIKQCEIDKKEHIIDLMAKVLTDCEFDNKCQECTFECERDYDQLFQCNKEYFTKKAEETNG